MRISATWVMLYSESFPDEHSRKGTALLTATFTNPLYSNPIQTLYFYFSVSGQLQLQTPFSLPEGVRTRELPLCRISTRFYSSCLSVSQILPPIANKTVVTSKLIVFRRWRDRVISALDSQSCDPGCVSRPDH